MGAERVWARGPDVCTLLLGIPPGLPLLDLFFLVFQETYSQMDDERVQSGCGKWGGGVRGEGYHFL